MKESYQAGPGNGLVQGKEARLVHVEALVIGVEFDAANARIPETGDVVFEVASCGRCRAEGDKVRGFGEASGEPVDARSLVRPGADRQYDGMRYAGLAHGGPERSYGPVEGKGMAVMT